MIDDTIKYVIHSTDGRGEFVSLPKKFMAGCTMKPDAFDDVVFQFVHEGAKHVDAYGMAEDFHYKVFGCNRYSSYESYYHSKYKK